MRPKKKFKERQRNQQIEIEKQKAEALKQEEELMKQEIELLSKTIDAKELFLSVNTKIG